MPVSRNLITKEEGFVISLLIILSYKKKSDVMAAILLNHESQTNERIMIQSINKDMVFIAFI
jgi:hypothetical protein